MRYVPKVRCGATRTGCAINAQLIDAQSGAFVGRPGSRRTWPTFRLQIEVE